MTATPENFVVWAEIPVTDMGRAMSFYSKVFDAELSLDETGPNPIAMFPNADKGGAAGHLYPGKPAAEGVGPTVHLNCPDSLEATMARFAAAGGKVISPPIPLPVGRFAYGIDLDGNSIGLFARQA